jgi:hypothetical protein
MKTKAIQLTVALMMIATYAFSQKANDKVWTSMSLKGTDKVEIRMLIPDNEVLVLNVYNQKDRKVYSKKIKNKNSLLFTHQIAEFPNGTYTYEILNNDEVVSSTAIVKSANTDLYYKPVEEFAEAR